MNSYKHALLLLLLFFLCVGCASQQSQPTPTATPFVTSSDSTPLTAEEIAEIDAAWQTEYASISGIAVRHGDALIYENYGDRQSADQFMEIYSVTKSVTSLLTGIALYNGDLESVDLLVADLLPAYMAAVDPQLQSMTVEHLLSMTSGIRSGWELEGTPINYYHGDFNERALALGYANDPGEVAFYNTLAASLLTSVLEAATGQDLETYAAEHLFEPLGIEWEWYRDDTDRVTSAAGLRLRTRDMTAIGQLVLNEGMWNGERLLSADYLQTAISPLNQAPHWLQEEVGYGYLWWIPDSLDQREVLAFGYAGQIIYILPETDLVVAMSSPCCSGAWENIELVNDLILPLVAEGEEVATAEEVATENCTGTTESFELEMPDYGTTTTHIYLPPCYEMTNERYPVVYLLHGSGLNERTWFRIGADSSAEKLIKNGDITPVILVTPPSLGFKTALFQDYFVNVLQPFIEKNYRTQGKPVLAGMSMGGGLTFDVGFAHPDLFAGLGILAIAPRTDMGEVVTGVSAAEVPPILLDVGSLDGLKIRQRELGELLDEKGIPHLSIEREGGNHTLDYWEENMENYLRWFDEQLQP